jgi:colanic acid biosynthesis glycosyl transferase WcaI
VAAADAEVCKVQTVDQKGAEPSGPAAGQAPGAAPCPRVLVLTQHYAPEPNFITQDVARVLARDAEVTVVTSHPNYPHGRFYPGTRWWLPRRSREAGVTVWRVPMFPDHSNSAVRRFASYVSFMLAAALFAPFVAGRPTVVWVYQTPFTTVGAALWFKFVLGSRIAFTCADLWPESFSAAGVSSSGRIHRWAFAYRRWTNRLADLIVCSTRGTMERFASEGIPRDRLVYAPIWVQGIEPGSIMPPAGEKVATLVYAGNLGPAQQLECVVRGARVLLDRGRDVRIDVYGTGSSAAQLAHLAEEVGATNVRLLGTVPPAEAFRAVVAAAGHIVCLRRSPHFRMTVPSKLSSAFAAGTPILFGLEGDSANLIRACDGGIEFDPDDPISFADATEALLAHEHAERSAMRSRLRSCYSEEFEPSRLLQKYRQFLLPACALNYADEDFTSLAGR